MTLYTKNAEYPVELPFRIRLSNGVVRTDRTTFTPEELADAGFIAVEDPPTVAYPNKLEWNGLGWVVREPNEIETEQRWSAIREECKAKLSETDYKVIKSVELGTALAPDITTYRQELRDIYNNVNSIDPWNFQWPVLSQDIT